MSWLDKIFNPQATADGQKHWDETAEGLAQAAEECLCQRLTWRCPQCREKE